MPLYIGTNILKKRWGLSSSQQAIQAVRKKGIDYFQLGKGRGSRFVFSIDDIRQYEKATEKRA